MKTPCRNGIPIGARKIKPASLSDCEKQALEHPMTFSIPTLKTRQSLKVGDMAKCIIKFKGAKVHNVTMDGERPWFRIQRRIKSGYIVKVYNTTVFPDKHDLYLGDRIKIEPKHICQAMRGDVYLP